MRNCILFVLVVASLESGCGAKLPSMKPFKMDIQQGNVVTSKMLMQLRPGMTRSQVRYIMGTPLIVDSFSDRRWDYFYEMRQQGKIVEKRRVILDFDKDSLVAVRGDVIPSAENPDVKTIIEAPVKKADAAKNESWIDKLKFWEDDAPPVQAPSTKLDSADITVVAEPPLQAERAGVTQMIAAEEVVPPIPEGENKAAVLAQETVKANPPESSTAELVAGEQAMNEKTMAAQIAGTVDPPPVFEQDAATVVAIAPNEELKAAESVASTESALSTAIPTLANASEAAVTLAVAETDTESKNNKKLSVPEQESKLLPVAPAVRQASPPAAVNMAEEKEVIPYIPEGEYVAPVIPTEQEMIKGNMGEANVPVTDAEAHQVTEKGVAPKAEAANEPPPTFIAEPLPQTEPEPVLPSPPSQSVANVVPEEPVMQAAVANEPVTPNSPPVAITDSKNVNEPAAVEISTPESQASTDVTPVLPPETLVDSPVSADSAVAISSAHAVAPALATTEQTDINHSVAQWAQAWRSKNIKNYLAAYAPDFLPESLSSRAAWEAQRKQRLSPGQGPITLVLSNIQVQRDGDSAVVQFQQKYSAKVYKDVQNKTLEMRYAPGQKRWLITRERTETIPAVAEIEATSKVMLAGTSTSVPAIAASEFNTQSPDVPPELSVEAALEAWAQAWQTKNLNAYFAAYSPEFVPTGLPSYAAWKSQRNKRLSPQQGKISLEITDVRVVREGESAVATFKQKYASKAYRDEMVKLLQLKWNSASKRWLIVRETAGGGAEVSSAKQMVIAPEPGAAQLDGMAEPIGF